MTDHGFICTGSGSKRNVNDIAKEVSRVQGVISTYVVKAVMREGVTVKEGYESDYQIIIEFDPRPVRETIDSWNWKSILDEIRKIEGIHPPYEVWIKQSNHQAPAR